MKWWYNVKVQGCYWYVGSDTSWVWQTESCTHCLLVFYSVPLFGRGLRTLPLYPLPRGQERRPSATPGTGPAPCGAASLHSHMESRGFRSPQTGPLLSAPGTVKTRGKLVFGSMGTHYIQWHVLKLTGLYVVSNSLNYKNSYSMILVEGIATQLWQNCSSQLFW